MSNNNKKLIIFMPIIIAVAIIIGMLIGNKLNFSNSQNVFVYPSQDKLNAVLDYVTEEYVDSVSKDYLIEETIPEILANLDPHSIYIPASDFAEMNEPLEGNFDGIGVQFNIMNDTVMVVNTIPGGPSESVGVLPGDRIVKINDTIVAGISISTTEVMKKLKGRRGTEVTISVKRKGEAKLIDITIERNRIPLESVDVAYMIDESTGYIKISKFAKTTYEEFMNAVINLKNSGMNKVIIDLRNNNGGYMDGATRIADEFLSGGKMIVYTEGFSRSRSETVATSKGECQDYDLVILLDEWSASASEILAGAIQDNDRGLIIGRRSFGKGLVQEPTFFSDGSSMRLTVARYYTPTGRSIQKSYKNGTDEYFNELADRFLHGELSEEDSIQFPDSLKFETPEGRIVYGGGGIMPDIFVPVDTSGITEYLTSASSKGLIYKFAFDYADKHRKELSKFKSADELENYLNKKDLVSKFVKYAESKDLPTNKTQLELSKKIIHTQIKAYIARNTIDNLGFYPIIKQLDNTLLRAVSELNKEN
jgi:carboxyl-terminal processing protease